MPCPCSASLTATDFISAKIVPQDVERGGGGDLILVVRDDEKIADVFIKLGRAAGQHLALVGKAVDERGHARHVAQAGRRML